ncbi:hypothetical protein Pmar_PMAR005952, partial [Perkinsus marinus ATCC 50983]
MSVSPTDIASLRQQIADLANIMSSKQDVQVMKGSDGNVLGIQDCLVLIERKIKALEDKTNMSLSALNAKIGHTNERVGTIDARMSDYVSKLNDKIDNQSQMMKDMYSLISNMNKRGENQTTSVLPKPRERVPAPVRSTQWSYTKFDYKNNAKVVVFGVPEADTTTEKEDGTPILKPTVKEQVESALTRAGARCATDSMRTAKRLGAYRSDRDLESRPRPICIQFAQPDVASEFVKANGVNLRNQGLGIKWWRPYRPRASQATEEISSMAARIDELARLVKNHSLSAAKGVDGTTT